MTLQKTRGSIATCSSILARAIRTGQRLNKQLSEATDENKRRLTEIKRKNETWIKHLEDKLQGLLATSIANR